MLTKKLTVDQVKKLQANPDSPEARQALPELIKHFLDMEHRVAVLEKECADSMQDYFTERTEYLNGYTDATQQLWALFTDPVEAEVNA